MLAYPRKAVHTGENPLPGASHKLPWLQFLEQNRRKTKLLAMCISVCFFFHNKLILLHKQNTTSVENKDKPNKKPT